MLKKRKLLLVEDDPGFREELKDYLLLNNYDVVHASDSEEGLKKYEENSFDICLLDTMLPENEGLLLAKAIKKINPNMPIIFLTAKTLKKEVFEECKVAVENYISKPFDSKSLLSKINDVFQQKLTDSTKKNYSQDEFTIKNITFNAKSRSLIVKGKERRLSIKENELLKLLCVYKNDLMPRKKALIQIWQDESYFTSRSMDVYISKLRKYLKPETTIEIKNFHGKGFALMTLD